MKRLLKLLIIAALIIYVRDTIINKMDKNIISIQQNNSIILNVQAKPIELFNGCAPASVQTIIKYVAKKEISQYQLAQEVKYNPENGTQLFNTRNVLNKHLSSYCLKGEQYLYTYFGSNFGATTQQQLLFFKMIYYSLENNFPIHFAIHGYWNKYYNNQFINHAVVLNGVEKADMIENYTYHISDNNSPNTDMTFKSRDLPKLFNGSGEMNYYSYKDNKKHP